MRHYYNTDECRFEVRRGVNRQCLGALGAPLLAFYGHWFHFKGEVNTIKAYAQAAWFIFAPSSGIKPLPTRNKYGLYMLETHANRCSWPTKDERYLTYHDQEWGRAVHDDKRLFEQLVLEGAQAGLSWITILKRRHHYKRVFCQYDLVKLAAFTEHDIAIALLDKGIIRNRLKVQSVVNNAEKFIAIQQEFGTFDAYIWGFVGGVTIVNQFVQNANIPAQTELSVVIAKDLKNRGFKFVGPIGMYAYMQSIGMVNDHIKSCFCYSECC